MVGTHAGLRGPSSVSLPFPTLLFQLPEPPRGRQTPRRCCLQVPSPLHPEAPAPRLGAPSPPAPRPRTSAPPGQAPHTQILVACLHPDPAGNRGGFSAGSSVRGPGHQAPALQGCLLTRRSGGLFVLLLAGMPWPSETEVNARGGVGRGPAPCLCWTCHVGN